MMIGLVIVNFGNVVTEFAGIAGSLELFGVNKYLHRPIGAVIVWLVCGGPYKYGGESIPRRVVLLSHLHRCRIPGASPPGWKR